MQRTVGHSFCIGAPTSAVLAGVEDSTIQLLGRWWSAAFLRYIRTPHKQLAAMSLGIFLRVEMSLVELSLLHSNYFLCS